MGPTQTEGSAQAIGVPLHQRTCRRNKISALPLEQQRKSCPCITPWLHAIDLTLPAPVVA
jgi:hypothetical protein